MELYDENGESVTAFTQKELDAKVKEATTEASTKTKVAEDSLAEKTTEYDKLNKLHEDKKTSYSELQKKTKEDEKNYKEVLERDTDIYNKAIEDKVKEIAGDDKEYSDALHKQLEREGVGFETADAKELDKQLSEAKALTNIELSREVKSPVGGGGEAPRAGDDNTDFTETTEGKATFDVLSSMMGHPSGEEAK